MKYVVAKIEELKHQLSSLPKAETGQRQISKQEAISMLGAEIRSLRQRDYTLDQVAEMLGEHGILISVATLKTYLRRAKGRAAVTRADKGATAPRSRSESRKPTTPVPPEETRPGTLVAPTATPGGFTVVGDTDEI